MMKNNNIENYINNKFNKNENFKVEEIKGDASNRKYYRAISEKRKFIVMDSSLEKRNFNNFLKFSSIYSRNKILIPKIFKKDLNKKILFLEDLGENLIFNKINTKNSFKIYEKSILNILNVQKIREKNISNYLHKKYFDESFLFINWVLKEFLKINISNADNKKLNKSIKFIIDNINHNTNVLVHRDYHSKNIFYKNKKITIIDYQDSVYGSPLYDLVSLLNDCYRDIDIKSKNKLIDIFFNKFNENNSFTFSMDEFLHNFYLLTAQRHLKASGIFCRLSVRNKRHNYLQHLERTLNYIVNASSYYGSLDIINTYVKEALSLLDESNYSRRW